MFKFFIDMKDKMSTFTKVAGSVAKAFGSRVSTEDHNAEWQRVNSYIADVLKDSHVLYAKLARLQGDFSGEELAKLSKVSQAVLAIGDELSVFSKAFYEGKYEILQSEFTYGETGGAPIPNPKAESLDSVEAGAGGTPAPSYDEGLPGITPEGGEEEDDEDEDEDEDEEGDEDYDAPQDQEE